MAATTPARWHGLERVGELAPGCRADLCVVDDHGRLLRVMQAGTWVDAAAGEEAPMLAGLREVLDPAVDAGTGVGAFNVICLEHAEALVWGAEAANLPVVLQVSENAVLYHRSLEPILIATVALARNADVPAVVHLDHVTDLDLVRAGVELGRDLGHVRRVPAVVRRERRGHRRRRPPLPRARRPGRGRARRGRWQGRRARSTARTRPDEAIVFVDDTDVDALAVAVGSSHAMTERTTQLDLDLVARLRRAVGVPLVLHGSSGSAGRRAGPGRPGRADQDQHRYAPERHPDPLGAPDPGRPAAAGGSAQVPRPRPGRRGRRGRAAAPAARRPHSL